jgi:hypothetical protein
MSLYGEILLESNLLLEKTNEVTEDKIRDAIENGKIVSIMYNDKEPGSGKSWRYIYPVVYGELKDRKTNQGNGHMAVRAYQDGGSTKRGEKKAWKLFRLDRIVAWYNQENTDEDKTHTFNAILLQDFNQTGDKHFFNIKYHSPLINVQYDIDDKPIKKSDIQQGETKPETTKQTQAPNIKYVVNPEWKNQYDKNAEISVDNKGNVGYLSTKGEEGNTVDAPDTKPITKAEVNGTPIEPPTAEPNAANVEADNKPITKDEVNAEGEQEQPQENELTTSFNDMMNRWKENAVNKTQS